MGTKEVKGTKLCKHCQTEIPKKAKTCPNCKKKQGGIIKWIVIAFVALILIGSISGGEDDEKTTSDKATNQVNTDENNETEVVEIEYQKYNVAEMINTLNENALKAEKEFQDQYVEITGRLGVIDSDGNYITLYPSNDEWAIIGVQCFIQNEEQLNKVLEMKVGDTVVLRGKIISVGEVIGYSLDIDSID